MLVISVQFSYVALYTPYLCSWTPVVRVHALLHQLLQRIVRVHARAGLYADSLHSIYSIMSLSLNANLCSDINALVQTMYTTILQRNKFEKNNDCRSSIAYRYLRLKESDLTTRWRKITCRISFLTDR